MSHYSVEILFVNLQENLWLNWGGRSGKVRTAQSLPVSMNHCLSMRNRKIPKRGVSTTIGCCTRFTLKSSRSSFQLQFYSAFQWNKWRQQFKVWPEGTSRPTTLMHTKSFWSWHPRLGFVPPGGKLSVTYFVLKMHKPHFVSLDLHNRVSGGKISSDLLAYFPLTGCSEWATDTRSPSISRAMARGAARSVSLWAVNALICCSDNISVEC